MANAESPKFDVSISRKEMEHEQTISKKGFADFIEIITENLDSIVSSYDIDDFGNIIYSLGQVRERIRILSLKIKLGEDISCLI